MKKLLILAFVLAVSCICGFAKTQNVTTTSILFDHSQLTCSEVTATDGQTYAKIDYPESFYIGEHGHPSVPMKIITLTLPGLAENISVAVQNSGTSVHQLSYRIFPIQPDIPTLIGDYEQPFVPCDSIIYTSASGYPQEQAYIVGLSRTGTGETHVKVAVSPLVYKPLEQCYMFYDSVTISVNYDYIATEGQSGGTDGIRDIGLPYYEYCVITTQSLKESFNRLVAWRRQQGLDAGVVCVEDILSNPCITGDTVSAIYDDAGKIRQYLQYAYQGGTKSVLFGGKDGVVPIRYGTGFEDKWNYQHNNCSKIPSDLYFSELQSNWNKDGDIFLGEPSDYLDFESELSIGRLLCTNTNEVENYTNKLFRYELNPGNGDYSYLKKAFFFQADNPLTFSLANKIKNQISDIFTNDTILSETPSANSPSPSYPYGHDVINAMKDKYSIAGWFGHGHPNAISSMTRGNGQIPCYGITSIELPINAPDSILYMEREDGNGLDCLENAYYPMVSYSTACQITPFDIFNEYTVYPNIGQSFTLGKNYGGPALVGNTRYGYNSASYELALKFFDYFLDNTIGDAHNKSRSDICSWAQYYFFIAHSSNVIGCPNIRIWTDTPFQFTANVIYETSRMRFVGYFHANKSSACVRNICEASDSVYIKNLTSNRVFVLQNAENSLITLTGKNCLPKILPLKLQNTSLHGKHYMLVTDMECGSNIRVGSTGNVVFENDADYEIEYSGSVTLGAGTEIKAGASVKIAPSNINY